MRPSLASLRLDLTALTFLSALAVAPLAGCGANAVEQLTDNIEGDEPDDESSDESSDDEDGPGTRDASRPPPRRDASVTPRDAGRDARVPDASRPPAPRPDGGTVVSDAGAMPVLDGAAPLPGFPNFEDLDLTPSPNNPKECPATAPENPIGSCIGVPLYAECNYTQYTCICDWVHWLCIFLP